MSPAVATQPVPAGVAEPRAAVERFGVAGESSPVAKARIAGVLWLMVVFTGMFAFFAQSSLVVAGDAAATAGRILASETTYRLGFAANQLAGVFYLGVTVLLYGLLKPVGRSVSLLAAAFGLAGVAAGAVASLFQLVPLALLGDASYLDAFTAGQLQALSLAFLSVGGGNVGMMFFGLQCVLLGYLVARSGFIPRVLGVLLAIGGASYVINSFANFVAPAFGAQVAPFILPAALVGEGALCLWLIARGVDVPRWQEQAARR